MLGALASPATAPNSVDPSESPVTPSTPGRNMDRNVGALYSPAIAQTIVASESPSVSSLSRSGSVRGIGVRVSQPFVPGKYIVHNNTSRDDDSLASSSAPRNANPTGPVSKRFPGRADRSVLRIYYQNVRGLKTKIDPWFLAATSCDYDVIIATESWLDDRIDSLQLFGPDFDVYRHDRDSLNSAKVSGGGVLIAVRSSLSSSKVETVFCVALEQIWVCINLGCKKVFLCSFYLPSRIANNKELLENHLESIHVIDSLSSPEDNVLVFGDYNCPDIKWIRDESGTATCLPDSSLSEASYLLVDGMTFFNLDQYNTVRNHLSRVLDLFFTNCSEVNIAEAADVLIHIDEHHPPFEVTIPVPEPFPTAANNDDPRQMDFKKADYQALSAFLNAYDWTPVLNCLDVDEATTLFLNIIQDWLNENVPLFGPRRRPPWSTNRLSKLRRKKNAALRNFRTRKIPRLKTRFQRASAAYSRLNASLYRTYIRRSQGNLRRNPKSFWSFVNSKRKNIGLPVSMTLNNNVANNNDEKCALFANHFASVFCSDNIPIDDVRLAANDVPLDAVRIDSPVITVEMVLKAAKKLKFSYAAGPDGIPAAVLKKCIVPLAKPLSVIFMLSLSQSRFPSVWKTSYMFPVYKKGDKRNVANYRGITSLSAGSKLFELIVNDYLFFNCKNYISCDQHGFFPGRSVTTNLVDFTSTCLTNMERGYQIDAIYTDLKAAFDRINHRILLEKLRRLGLSEGFVAWIESYLTNRKLRVRIANSVSDPFEGVSGVPQGSNLGPLYFAVFYNDAVPLLPRGCRLLYADDLKIYFVIRRLEDCTTLQNILDAFVRWCQNNRMILSIDKCSVISYHRKKSPICYDYKIEGVSLERTDSIRDLGVQLDSGLTFNEHRNAVINKANRQLGFMLKISRDFDDPYCLRSLYCALVRSLLESSSVVWAPYHSTWIDRIENVQKRFVRYVVDADNYEDRCLLLNLDSLEHRRCSDQAVFIAKVIKNEVDAPSLLARLSVNMPRRTLRNYVLLRPPPHRTDYGLNEPLTAMLSMFNRFYSSFDFNRPTSDFKRKIISSLSRV